MSYPFESFTSRPRDLSEFERLYRECFPCMPLGPGFSPVQTTSCSAHTPHGDDSDSLSSCCSHSTTHHNEEHHAPHNEHCNGCHNGRPLGSHRGRSASGRCYPHPSHPPCPQASPHRSALAHALVLQRGILSNLSADHPLSLSELTTTSPRTFALHEHTIGINQPGLYLIQAAIYVPASVHTNTTITLNSNGQVLPGMTLPVQSVCTVAEHTDTCPVQSCSPSHTHAVQGVLTLTAPASLTLHASSVIEWTATDPNTPMASLSILQLSDQITSPLHSCSPN